MLHCDTAKFEALRAFTGLTHCPHCGDLLIAPVASEFVEAGEIRHHWECEACGRASSTTVQLSDDEA